MEQINTRAKRWGNSLGIVLPKKIIDSQQIKEGSEIKIIIESKNKTKVKNLFGILKGKLKKDTETLMREIDRELWGIKK